MEKKENNQPLHQEAVVAYEDQNVIDALRHSNWFTTEYIEQIQASEPDPEREGLGPFKDKLLQDFYKMKNQLGKEHLEYKGVRNYLTQRMVGSQGHPLPLNSIEFTDSGLLDLARKMDINENHEVDRGMIGRVESMLQCLIAPESVRKKVVRIACGWGNERMKHDTLLWGELVRRGTMSYLQR